MKKLSCKKIRELIRDEEKGSREYKNYGFNKLSRDESSHKEFLKSIEKERCR